MNPFQTVSVYPHIKGGTRVEWRLKSSFNDSPPYTFELQHGITQNPNADDWTTVSGPGDDVFFLLDTEQHQYNNFNWSNYRVKLTTSQGEYFSSPQNSFGVLSVRHSRQAREVIRQEMARLKVDDVGQEMFLLKRRHAGPKCTSCLDYQTGEVLQGDCLECYGTGFIGGYFQPVPCFYVDISEMPHRNRLDGAQARGTVDDSRRVRGRFINIPSVFSKDILVDVNTDDRWIIDSYRPEAQIKTVPIVVMADLRLLEYSDIIYKFSIDLGDGFDFTGVSRMSDTPLNSNCRPGYQKTPETEDGECQNPNL